MIVQLLLDRPQAQFTNLDIVSGRVLLRLNNGTTVSSIVVKLEGESRTRLLAPSRPGHNDRAAPMLEVHKVLYKTQVVWPDQALQAQTEALNAKPAYTVPAGQYEYPFQFKIPFNNSCQNAGSLNANLNANLNFVSLAKEIAKPPTQHVKQTLPPPIYYPGEAEIRYYVKVTVNRPSLFKENPRAIQLFNFFPIEPPRPEPQPGEVYARRQHQFNPDLVTPPLQRQGSSFKDFIGIKSPTPPESEKPKEPPRFALDARLPNPAILTCGQDIPLRIILTQLSERSEPVYLQNLQVELVGYTKVRAHLATREESNSWVITSKSNMAWPLGHPADVVGTETEISNEFWYGHVLPNTVCPTFVTCNIERRYELQIKVGMGYGSHKQGHDQFVALPLKLDVQVLSGIKPSAEVLKAVVSRVPRPEKPPLQTSASGLSTNISPTDPFGQAPTPITPSSSSAVPSHMAFPPQPGQYLHADPEAGYDDAPPSYEDAIGQELPPIDGPRPDYEPPPPLPDGGSRIGNEKR